MAEIVDNKGMTHDVASQSKGNAALTTGIIGTSLSGLLALGGMAGLGGLFSGNNKCKNSDTCSYITNEELWLERKTAADQLATTKQMYENKISNDRALADAFFDAYKRDTDNSFSLYKYSRDNYDALTQKITDASFGLYKNQRDENEKTNARITESTFGLYKSQRDTKDELKDKINALECKIDVMQAIRPYQDALINAKIDNNALVADYNLSRRTCRMIEGQLVLPNSPEVTGFTSYNPCYVAD